MSSTPRTLRAGMVGMGMIFDETYRPFFERAHRDGLYERSFGDINVPLTAVATRTGSRADAYRQAAGSKVHAFTSFAGNDSVDQMLKAGVDVACVATPDDRHFEAARAILSAGVHALIEKPSVLDLAQLDELVALAERQGVLAKVVYHKLLDPDHKKLRTFVHDGVLQHVNNGYCSLLEPKSISGGQFAEWIKGRNPGTYVAVHYIKLIDFTFGGRLKTVMATGQRGLVGSAQGATWDTNQLRLIYEYDDGREAAFDIHTSWVGHSRRRGIECTVEGKTPFDVKITINTHYNGSFVEPWGERSQRGYGIEVLERFVREVARVEWGGPAAERSPRLQTARSLGYNDLAADRQVVAAVQALEAILAHASSGQPDGVVRVNDKAGGLALYLPGVAQPKVLYAPRV